MKLGLGLMAAQLAVLGVVPIGAETTVSPPSPVESAPLVYVASGPNGVAIVAVRGDVAETVATLSEPGFETEVWEGYGCVDPGLARAVVSYSPVEWANAGASRGLRAMTAVVDIDSGTVIRLPTRVRQQPHAVECDGNGRAVLSDFDGTLTTVSMVDIGTGAVALAGQLQGQVSRVHPFGSSLLGVSLDGAVIVPEGDATQATTVPLEGLVTDIVVGDDGSFHALTAQGTDAVFASYEGGALVQATVVGEAGDVALFPGEDQPILAGLVDSAVVGQLDASVIQTPEVPLAASSDGENLLLEESASAEVVTAKVFDSATSTTDTMSATSAEADQAQPSVMGFRSSPAVGISTGQNHSFGASRQPKPGSRMRAAATASPCAVGRNEPEHQVYQPTVQQVEWAVDLAVTGNLTVTRPANWGGHGLAAYTPQGLVPYLPLTGGGTIPPQVLLGIVAQESNVKQASWHVSRSMYGNPLIGDYYGSGGTTAVDYSKSDCGYGVGQITTGMARGSTYWGPNSSTVQKAIAWDYTVNVAAAARILSEKWNQLKAAGLIAQDGLASNVEAWYFAIWAYNTGFTPPNPAAPTATWGVGWTNNPRQPDYTAGRAPFLKLTRDDARYPSKWPYQERIFGWASYGFVEGGSQQYLRTTAPLTDAPAASFCSAANFCNPTQLDTVTNSYCTKGDRTMCRWRWSATWASIECGVPVCTLRPQAQYRFNPGTPEPAGTTPPFTPVCSAPFPAGTVIVDNLAQSKNRVGCPETTNAGTFSFVSSPPDSALVDLHQLGTGFGGQVWMSRTKSPGDTAARLTGTWTPPSSTTGWRRIYVHLPAAVSESAQATYQVKSSSSVTAVSRVVNTRWNENRWVDLGAYQLGSGASVSLSNATYTDWSSANVGRSVYISWDAIAFAPTTAPTKKYVALGDSYQAGEGVEPYFRNTDVGGALGDGGDQGKFRNACHRSASAYPALIAAAANVTDFGFLACSGAVIKNINGNPNDPSATQWTEIPQLAQGAIDSTTTAVSIGIGGNDARFSAVLQSCILSLTVCDSAGYVMEGDSAPLRVVQAQIIADLQTPLRQLYQQIKAAAAPNAKVVVVGYPRLFRANPYDNCNGLAPSEQVFLNSLADQLTTVIRQASAAAGVTFYDPNTAYNGRRVCESSEAINGAVLWSSSGSSPWNSATRTFIDKPGSGTFHPKASGHALIAADVRALLGL